MEEMKKLLEKHGDSFYRKSHPIESVTDIERDYFSDASDTDDVINVSLSSKEKLGKLLSPDHVGIFATPLGDYYSAELYVAAVTKYENFPPHLNVPSMAKSWHRMLKKIPNVKKKKTKNTQALILLCNWCKIIQNKKLEKMLRTSKGRFMSFHYRKFKEVPFGGAYKVHHIWNLHHLSSLEIIRNILRIYGPKQTSLRRLALSYAISDLAETDYLFEDVSFYEGTDEKLRDKQEILDLIIKEEEKAKRKAEAEKVRKEETKEEVLDEPKADAEDKPTEIKTLKGKNIEEPEPTEPMETDSVQDDDLVEEKQTGVENEVNTVEKTETLDKYPVGKPNMDIMEKEMERVLDGFFGTDKEKQHEKEDEKTEVEKI